MKRDTIFYNLFKRSPTAVFDLLPTAPDNAADYRFESVAVKEPRFEIDGVLLPPPGAIGTVYFIEVQFQKDKTFYERVFAEIALYYYRNCGRFSDWQVIVIYPSRSTEQSTLHPHRSFLNGGQVHRVFLDELGNIREQPLWVALMVLTTVDESQAPDEARYLIRRTQAEKSNPEKRAIIETATTIISYKFVQLSPRDIEAMLDITFEETRVYREIKEEAEQKGLQEGLQKGLQEGLQRGLQEGLQEGRREEALSLVNRLLLKRVGELDMNTQNAVSALPLEKLEELSEAILDFESAEDLLAWLNS